MFVLHFFQHFVLSKGGLFTLFKLSVQRIQFVALTFLLLFRRGEFFRDVLELGLELTHIDARFTLV